MGGDDFVHVGDEQDVFIVIVDVLSTEDDEVLEQGDAHDEVVGDLQLLRILRCHVEVDDVGPVHQDDAGDVLHQHDEQEDGADESLLDVQDKAEDDQGAVLLHVPVVVDEDVEVFAHVGVGVLVKWVYVFILN